MNGSFRFIAGQEHRKEAAFINLYGEVAGIRKVAGFGLKEDGVIREIFCEPGNLLFQDDVLFKPCTQIFARE